MIIKKLNHRQKKILKLVIDKYIVEHSSISSLNLVKNTELSIWSSATLRNDMAFLEKQGFLIKEYCSSGKIPTEKGYRFYIEVLMDKFEEDLEIKQKLIDVFSSRHSSIDQVLDSCAKLLSEFLNLPTILVKNLQTEKEFLRKIDIAILNDKQFVVYLITSSGQIIQDIVMFSDDDMEKKDDLLAAVRLLNEKLFDCPIDLIKDRVIEVIPEIKKQIHQFEFVYETLISQMIIKKLNESQKLDQKIYNTKSLVNQTEFSKNEINIESLLNLIENYSAFSPVNYNFLKTGNTLFNINKEDGLSVVTTTIDIQLTKHQLSVVGPVRMNYPLIKCLLEFIQEKLST